MKKVLLINDDHDFQYILTSLLSRNGYIAKSMDDDEPFLAEIDSYKPDLVILDMTVERDKQICKRLKNFNDTKSIPVLLLTGNTLPIHEAECEADGYINKPFQPGELIAKINELIKK